MFRFLGSAIDLAAGCQNLEPGDILGTASSPVLCVPLELLATHGTPNDVNAVTKTYIASTPPSASTTSATPGPRDEPPPDRLCRLNESQRESFLHMWRTVPSYTGHHWLGPHRCRCSVNDTHELRRHHFVIQIELREIFPTSLRNQSPSGDITDSITPISTEPSPFQTCRYHIGLLYSYRPYLAFHV